MAENTEQFEESLARAREALERYSDTYVEYFDDLKKLKKGTKEYLEAQDKLWKKLKQSQDAYEKSVRNNTATYDSSIEHLKKLNDAIENTTDAAQKDALQKSRDLAAEQARQKILTESAAETAKKMASTTFAGTGQFVKSLQNGADATQMSADLLTGVVDITGAGIAGAGKAISGLGAASALAGPEVWAFSAALMAVGGAMQWFGEAGSKLAKFGISVMSKEVDKTIKSFNTISATGTMFANGMTGMRNAAKDAGLTVEQFSNVIKTNQLALSQTGLGMAEAAATVGRVSKSFSTFDKNGKITGNSLLKLGYSFEEQAGLVAETMADMRSGGMLATASDKDIQQQTQEYAENLRVISAITGEDAKKKMAQARDEMQNMAVQNKLMEMQANNPEAYKKMMATLATLPPEMHKAFLQKFTLGVVADKTSAAFGAFVPEMEQGFSGMIAVINDGTKNADDATDEAAKSRAAINQGMMRNREVFSKMGEADLAGVGGLVGDISKFSGSVFDQVKGTTEDTAKKARDSVNNQMAANDELTVGVLTAAIAAQDLAVAIQERLLPLMGDYATITAKILEALDNIIKESGIDTKPKVVATGLEQTADPRVSAAINQGNVPTLEEAQKFARKRAEEIAAKEAAENAKKASPDRKTSPATNPKAGITFNQLSKAQQDALLNAQQYHEGWFAPKNGKRGSASYDLNNPGNIIINPTTGKPYAEQAKFGATKDTTGRGTGAVKGQFAKFPTYEAGREAQRDLWKRKYGDKDISDTIAAWAKDKNGSAKDTQDFENYRSKLIQAVMDAKEEQKSKQEADNKQKTDNSMANSPYAAPDFSRNVATTENDNALANQKVIDKLDAIHNTLRDSHNEQKKTAKNTA